MTITIYADGFQNEYLSCNCDVLEPNVWDHNCDKCEGYGVIGPSTNYPELNTCYDNAVQLFKMLGICANPLHYNPAVMVPADILVKTAQYKPDKAFQYSRETIQEGNSIDFGLPAERLDAYVQALRNIANLALENEVMIKIA